MFRTLFGGKEGVKEPTTVDIFDRPLRCLVCSHDLFWRRTTQQNTPGLTFFNLEWLNRIGTSLICAKCGHVHNFLPPKD